MGATDPAGTVSSASRIRLADLGVTLGSTGLNEFEGANFCEDVYTYLT